MKKAFRDALQKEGVVLDDSQINQHEDLNKTRSVPSSPRPLRTELQRTVSDKEVNLVSSTSPQLPYRKSMSVPSLFIEKEASEKLPARNLGNEKIVVQRGRLD